MTLLTEHALSMCHVLLQMERQDSTTPRAASSVFHSFPQLPPRRSALHSGTRSAPRRVHLQSAPTEDPAKRLDQAVRLICSSHSAVHQLGLPPSL